MESDFCEKRIQEVETDARPKDAETPLADQFVAVVKTQAAVRAGHE